MSTINERFKEVRKACGKTQEEWGTIIGITRAGITDIEAGRRNVTDKHLVALKNAGLNINIEYIKDENGKMFVERTRNQEILDFSNKLMESKDDAFSKRFTLALSKLTEDEWKVLEKIIDSIK